MQKTVEQWEKELAYWEQQAVDNERYWRVIRWFPALALLGVPVGLAHIPAGALVAVSALLTWGTGWYMITVRRFEFRHNVRETLKELETARAVPRASAQN